MRMHIALATLLVGGGSGRCSQLSSATFQLFLVFGSGNHLGLFELVALRAFAVAVELVFFFFEDRFFFGLANRVSNYFAGDPSTLRIQRLFFEVVRMIMIQLFLIGC